MLTITYISLRLKAFQCNMLMTDCGRWESAKPDFAGNFLQNFHPDMRAEPLQFSAGPAWNLHHMHALGQQAGVFASELRQVLSAEFPLTT